MEADLDASTAALIAELVLDDIEEIKGRRKGKARSNAPQPDEDIAFSLQEESIRLLLSDIRLAQSISQALTTDTALLIAAQAAQEDHRYAEALSQGLPLPEKSENQRILEDPSLLQSQDRATSIDEPVIVPTASASINTARVECIICGDLIPAHFAYQAPCSHQYCRRCLTDLIRACVGDESLYPPRCCTQPFTITDVLPRLALAIRLQFESKAREFGVSAMRRLYCANGLCSTFLGSTEGATGGVVRCDRCATLSCSACKQLSHPGRRCPEDAATLAVRALAREQHWQTCPGCENVVELDHGCYHMTCRCRTEFCYLCAARWKTCRCEQWDENRLLETAQRRVANEMGRRNREAQPQVFRHQVEQQVEHLRANHDCEQHLWRSRRGGAECEECHNYLRDFILVCRNCHLEACVRCSRNRL